MPALDSGAYGQTRTRPSYTRPRAQRFGAKRDQYGRVIPTTNATPSGGLSREHDWSAFDRAFAKPAPVAPPPVTPQPAPAPVASAVRTAGAVAATAMGGPMAALPAAIQPPTAPAVTVAQPPAMPSTRHERIVADPNDWRGKTGVANPPPAQNFGGEGARTRQVYMKPIPAPLTGPMGNASTDAANLAQNQAMYAPGGMSETAYQRDTRVAARNAARNAIPANVTAAAGTGQNVAGNYGTAYSKPAVDVNTIPQKSVAGVAPAGARNDINTGGNVLAVAPAPVVSQPVAPVAAPPQQPAPVAPPVAAAPPQPAPAAPITPHSVGMAIHNTPGAIADVATSAYETTRDAVVPAVTKAANTVQTVGTDFTAGLQGKTPDQWRAEIAENERLKANAPQRPAATVDTSAFRTPGMVSGPMGIQTMTAPRPPAAPTLPTSEVPMLDAYARKKKAAQPMLN